MKPVVVGITGASGTIYGIRLVQTLLESGREVHLVISEPARLVIKEEQGIVLKSLTRREHLEELFGSYPQARLSAFSFKDFTAPIASGSYPVEGMVIVPCSMGSLAAIAHGITRDLVHRAADVMLKEGRPLLLVPRETPFNVIHLENMLKLAQIGAKIIPAMPSFYHLPQTIDDLVEHFVHRLLDHLGVGHTQETRWTGSKPARQRAEAATRGKE